MGRHRNVVPYVDASPRGAYSWVTPAHRGEPHEPNEPSDDQLPILIKQARRAVQLLAADHDPAALEVQRDLDHLRAELAERKRARA